MSFIGGPRVFSFVSRISLVTQKRFNRREAIHRYVEHDKFKKHMLAATQPYMKREFKLPEESCRGFGPKEIPEHPLDKILINELVDDINQSNFLLFIQYTYTKFQADRVYRNTIIKTGCKFHAFNNIVYRGALTILNRERALDLLITRNAFVTGKYESLTKCISAINKMPEYLLLCGYIDDQLYNVDQLKIITSMANLDTSRANLVATLATPSINLHSNLEAYMESNKTSSEQDDKSN